MNGFRIFTLMAAACILIGLCILYIPGCNPPNMGDCTWDVNSKSYSCPNER